MVSPTILSSLIGRRNLYSILSRHLKWLRIKFKWEIREMKKKRSPSQNQSPVNKDESEVGQFDVPFPQAHSTWEHFDKKNI